MLKKKYVVKVIIIFVTGIVCMFLLNFNPMLAIMISFLGGMFCEYNYRRLDKK